MFNQYTALAEKRVDAKQMNDKTAKEFSFFHRMVKNALEKEAFGSIQSKL
ncbi:MAG: hypothetical protein P4L22_01595 [Candidatus Babeliales bacterium]|nr:hypothetical protein [Candidatus Babeliales bacterium]